MLRRQGPVREFSSTVTSKGQVTVPAEVRRYLGLSPRDALTFTLKEGEDVVIRPARRDIMALAGAAGKLKRQLTWDRVREIAHEESATR